MHKVLFVVTPQSPLLTQYVNALYNGISSASGTANDTGYEAVLADSVEAFRLACDEFSPDIIHLHGCNSTKLNKALLRAQKEGCRIIISPHGEMESWSKEKEPFRRNMQTFVSHAYTLIARSQTEADELEALHLNPRVEIIHNPVITRTTTFDRMVREHITVYNKLLNSNVLELFNDSTKDTVRTLLKAGITGDERWVTPCDMKDVQWNLLSTYAQQEGITDYCERGLLTLGLDGLMPTPAPSYLPNKYEKPEPIAGKPIVDMVHIIKSQVASNSLSLLSLANLDVALRHDDVEDDVVMQQLEAEHLAAFMASLLTVMSEQTGLTEGFMPCESSEDNVTKRIRDCIIHHLQI